MPQKFSSFNPDETELQWFCGEDMIHEMWDSTADEAIAWFEGWAQKIKELKSNPNIRDIHVEQESDYEGGHYTMLKWEWLETPEQRDNRLAETKRYADERDNARRAQYEQLKAEFGE